MELTLTSVDPKEGVGRHLGVLGPVTGVVEMTEGIVETLLPGCHPRVIYTFLPSLRSSNEFVLVQGSSV